DEEQPVRRLQAPELLDRRRPLVRHDGHADAAPRLEVGVRLRGPYANHPDLFSFPCFLAYRSPVRKTSRPSGTETRPRTTSGQTSAQATPVPCRICSRFARSAYVAGEIFEIHCIQPGSTETS